MATSTSMIPAASSSVGGVGGGGVTTSIQGREFNLGHRYTDLKFVGKGAYGVVVSARDNNGKSGSEGIDGERVVAVKKVELLSNHLSFTRRTLREIKILLALQHESVINIKNMMAETLGGVVTAVYLVMPLMESDLSDVLTTLKRSGQSLPAEHACFWSYEILRGLKYIHSANVLHRDLKPSNILINPKSDCNLKICDFGLSRVSDPDNPAEAYSEYVATRWYRAPEVMINPRRYSAAMDVWSVGCIVAEMLTCRPLVPGRNALDQLRKSLVVTGVPSEEELHWVHREGMCDYILKQAREVEPRHVELSARFPGSDPNAIGLLGRMLQFSPHCRITAEDSLGQAWFHKYHDPSDEPVCERVLTGDALADMERQSLDELKESIGQEVTTFRQRLGLQDGVRELSGDEAAAAAASSPMEIEQRAASEELVATAAQEEMAGGLLLTPSGQLPHSMANAVLKTPTEEMVGGGGGGASGEKEARNQSQQQKATTPQAMHAIKRQRLAKPDEREHVIAQSSTSEAESTQQISLDE